MSDLIYCKVTGGLVNKEFYPCQFDFRCDECPPEKPAKEKIKRAPQKPAQTKPAHRKIKTPAPRAHRPELKAQCYLWFEFLRRSDNYRRYSDLRRARNPVPDDLQYLAPEFLLYGDIKYLDAGKFYKNILNEIEKARGKAVSEYADNFPDLFDRYVAAFTHFRKRPPTLDEISDYILTDLKNPAHVTVTISFNNDLTIDEIKNLIIPFLQNKMREFKTQLKETGNKRQFKNSVYSNGYTNCFKPTTRVRRELTNYLKIYDEAKIKKRKFKNETRARVYYRNIEKAKKIISNVEHGEFPGKY